MGTGFHFLTTPKIDLWLMSPKGKPLESEQSKSGTQNGLNGYESPSSENAPVVFACWLPLKPSPKTMPPEEHTQTQVWVDVSN